MRMQAPSVTPTRMAENMLTPESYGLYFLAIEAPHVFYDREAVATLKDPIPRIEAAA